MDKLVAQVLAWEGPPTNDPDDPGGRTQHGISEAAHPGAWADGKVTLAEAEALYRQKYLIATKIIDIPHPGLQAQLFDWAVNSGPGTAVRALQRLLKVKADGLIGPQTLGALEKADLTRLNNALVEARVAFIERLIAQRPKAAKYRAGWTRRARSFVLPL